MATLEDHLKTRHGGNLLDIACGGGNFTRRMIAALKSYDSVTGLDIKPALKDDFLKNVEGHDIAFVASDIADYLETAKPFDTISVSNALHHLERAGEILGKLRRVLPSGGWLIINEMYCDALTPAQEIQRDQHHFMARLHRKTGEYHRETFTRPEIRQMAEAAGLTVLHAFDTPNSDAPVRNDGKEAVLERLQPAIEKAYPGGAPADIAAERDALVARAARIGVAPPPQLALVCAFAS